MDFFFRLSSQQMRQMRSSSILYEQLLTQIPIFRFRADHSLILQNTEFKTVTSMCVREESQSFKYVKLMNKTEEQRAGLM